MRSKITSLPAEITRSLFDNSHYYLSALADPELTDVLKRRYQAFMESGVKQLLDNVAKRNREIQVIFINLIGSYSVYRDYGDIDISVGILGGKLSPETIFLNIKKENNEVIKQQIEIFYHDLDTVAPEDYYRFLFSKVVVYGKMPGLFEDQLLEKLEAEKFYAISQYDKFIATDPRKALHRLLSAFRHLYKICEYQDLILPPKFFSGLKNLYEMEKRGNYDTWQIQGIKRDLFQ
ncbi:MAG: hypothetical protein PHV30_05400 [Candidatus Margulisbacteria bacterium]|nr:hypothetical protein [Candidatus Margulisiibacteriota bacterium]